MADADLGGGDMAAGDLAAGEVTEDRLAEGEVDLSMLTDGKAGSAGAWRRVVASGELDC